MSFTKSGFTSSKGERGPRGFTGIGFNNASITNGNLIITKTDNTTINAGSVVGGSVNLENVNSNIFPSITNTYDIGSSTNKFKDLHLNGIVYGQNVSLTGCLSASSGAFISGGLFVQNSNMEISGNILPATNLLYNVGSSTRRFGNVFCRNINGNDCDFVNVNSDKLVLNNILKTANVSISVPTNFTQSIQLTTPTTSGILATVENTVNLTNNQTINGEKTFNSNIITANVIPLSNDTHNIGSITNRYYSVFTNRIGTWSSATMSTTSPVNFTWSIGLAGNPINNTGTITSATNETFSIGTSTNRYREINSLNSWTSRGFMSGTYQIPFFTNGTLGNPDSSTININGFHAKSAVRCGLCLEADTDGTPNTHNTFIWMRQDNGASNGVIYLDESTPGNDMIFYNNTTQSTATNRFRFSGAGTVNYNDFRITSPVTYLTIDNNGIQFQNGGSSLNHYEEGTFTGNPASSSNSSNPSLITFKYVRVGRTVTLSMTTDFTITASGAISFNNSFFSTSSIRPPLGTTYNLPIISSQGMISTRISNTFIDWFGSSGSGLSGSIQIWHYSVSYQLN